MKLTAVPERLIPPNGSVNSKHLLQYRYLEKDQLWDKYYTVVPTPPTQQRRCVNLKLKNVLGTSISTGAVGCLA